jgi:hypothetical protein
VRGEGFGRGPHALLQDVDERLPKVGEEQVGLECSSAQNAPCGRSACLKASSSSSGSRPGSKSMATHALCGALARISCPGARDNG